MRRSDSLPPFSSGFVSFAFRYRLSPEYSLLFPGRRTQGRPGRDYRLFPSVFSSGDGRVSQVPGEPTVCMPCSSTPAGPEDDAVLPPDGAFRKPELVGSRELQFRGSIARPTNSLCTLHVQDYSSPRNTRFRLSAHLAGRAWLPAGFQRRFQHSIHSPSPGFTWRTRNLHWQKWLR